MNLANLSQPQKIGLGILLALFLAALAAWGSRETLHIKERQESSKQIQTLSEEKKTLQVQKLELEQASRSGNESAEETVPVQMPNGTIAYVTRKSSRSFQEALQKVKSESSTQILELTKKSELLEAKLKTYEKDSVKAAPRWYAGTNWKPLSPGLEAFVPEIGMNVGALLIKAGHPLAVKSDADGKFIFEPHAGIGFRF